MYRRIAQAIFVLLGATGIVLQAQEFNIFGRTAQVHGFLSQGFVYTGTNNWLTMNTSSGSGAMTDMGLNVSSQVTDSLWVGAQVYDRNLGQLGQYHPELDWASVDYAFKPWLGIRGGKVKTTLGLYNDTQDLEFLRTFVLLPQSVYPTDLRDTAIAHLGGDVYGTVPLKRRLGTISYTAYAGHRSDSIYSGFVYLLTKYQIHLRSLSGLQYGGDLRWHAPVKGLLVGASRINQEITGHGSIANSQNPSASLVPYEISTKADSTDQFYSQFSAGKVRVDAEYRRYVSDHRSYLPTVDVTADVQGWYVAGVYRVAKRFQVGSYYSRYTATSIFTGAASIDNQTDTSLPQNHVYDKVVSGRLDLDRYWNVKIEGHFMDGVGVGVYTDGFYPQVNPDGFRPNTNALMAKTSFNF